VLLADEDVGDGSLARHLGECALDGAAVICSNLLDPNLRDKWAKQ